jgi:hypothetical protein
MFDQRIIARRVLARWLSIDRREQLPDGTRGWRTEALVEINGLGILFPDRSILLRKLGIPSERFVDPAGIARIQGAGRMPWQQHFYFTRLLLQHSFSCRYHWPASLRPAASGRSADFLRAYDTRIQLKVAATQRGHGHKSRDYQQPSETVAPARRAGRLEQSKRSELRSRFAAFNGRLARLVGLGCPMVRSERQVSVNYRNGPPATPRTRRAPDERRGVSEGK